MENNDLLRRAADLYERSQRSATLTHTGFLSPAERYALEVWAKKSGAAPVFCGGGADNERTAAFFLPDWMEELDAAEELCAIRLTAHFGEPGHRDYLGALLGMGIGREWLGDILIQGSQAWIFCLPSVQKHLLGIEKVGRVSVTAEAVPLSAVPAPTDQLVREGDILSLRGSGKGKITGTGGTSRKGRLFVYGEVYQ